MLFFLEGLIPLFKRPINQVLVCFGISYVEIDHVQGRDAHKRVILYS